MNERIKQLRKALKLTQQEFANRIQISRGALAVYEIGRNEPIDAVISLICREFNVSESWLRTGDGEMFVEPSEFSLDDLAKQCNASEIDLKIVKKYFELPANMRRMLVDHFKSIFAEEAPLISGTGEQGRTGEQKTPTPVFEDGPESDDEKSFMESVTAMDPGQQEQLFEQYDQMRKLKEQQRDASTASVPSAVDDKVPESGLPDQS